MANRLVGNADTRVKTELLNVRRVRLVGQRVEDGPGHKPHYRVKRSIDRPHPHFCTDSISLAVSAHVAQTYGGMQTRSQKRKGGLAPWQERRATEMLAADLAGATPLTEIAGACGLSSDHFARAFRKSKGVAPHAWLLQARVDRAMTLLRQHELPLSAIALACGFADQSHFTLCVFGAHRNHAGGVA